MSPAEPLRALAVVKQKDPQLPTYVEIPAGTVAPWSLEGTTTVRVAVDGHDAGRRSLKRWDDERWFLNLTKAFRREAGVEVGDEVEVRLEIASTELSPELRELLEEDDDARACWEGLTDSRRRAVREHVRDAKRSETRRRRARRMLKGS